MSDVKFDKVKDQFAKITEKFRQRIENTIHKFESPGGKKGKKGKGGDKPKKMTDETVAEATAPLKKKKKKKKNRD